MQAIMDRDEWLLNLMLFMDEAAPPSHIKVAARYHKAANNFVCLQGLVIEEADELVRIARDPFILNLPFTQGDVDKAKEAFICVAGLCGSGIKEATSDHVDLVQTLPALLRKFSLYYNATIELAKQMAGTEETPEKLAFAEAFHKANGHKFNATVYPYLQRNAERSQLIMADLPAFIGRLEQVVGRAIPCLGQAATAGMDARP